MAVSNSGISPVYTDWNELFTLVLFAILKKRCLFWLALTEWRWKSWKAIITHSASSSGPRNQHLPWSVLKGRIIQAHCNFKESNFNKNEYIRDVVEAE